MVPASASSSSPLLDPIIRDDDVERLRSHLASVSTQSDDDDHHHQCPGGLIHRLCAAGAVGCLRLVLRDQSLLVKTTNGYSIDARDASGDTPLHYCCRNPNRDTARQCAQLLIDRGADPNTRNDAGTTPIDTAEASSDPTLLAILKSPTNRKTTPSSPKQEDKDEEGPSSWDDGLLPDDIPTLKRICREFHNVRVTFSERCRETILQLIEEKHIAQHKNRLLEESAGISDRETSVRFTDQLQILQDENERQSATITYLKVRLNMLEVGAAQQEDYYRRNLEDVTRQHTEQLQAIFRRNEETERAFMTYRKLHADDAAELSRLRAEVAAGRGRPGKPGDRSSIDVSYEALFSEAQSLRRELAEAIADKLNLEERLKLSEKLKALAERENVELRQDMNKLRKNMHDEMMNQLHGARTEQDERDESNGAVVFVKGEGGSKRIKAATPEKLVERLVDPTVFDSQFLQVFLLTYRSYMTSKQVMDTIRRIFKENSQTEVKAGEMGVQPPIFMRIINTIKSWMENYWSDFQEDNTLLKDLTDFVDTVHDDKLTAALQTLVATKLQTTADPTAITTTTTEDTATSITDPTTAAGQQPQQPAPPKPILPRQLIKRYSFDNTLRAVVAGNRASVTTFGKMKGVDEEAAVRIRLADLEPLEVARQLTLIEHELFLNVKSREFLDLAWMKDDKDVRAPNITRMIQWSNHVVHWLISELVMIKDGAKPRAQMYEKIIQIAHHLDKLNNFNGVKEVLAALQSSSIYRLKKTKELVNIKLLRIYDDLIAATSSELNYKVLRSKVHTSKPPLIPFPGVYQGDLVFLDTCSKDILDGGLVNFQKFQKSFQKFKYVLEPVPDIQDYIRYFPALGDDLAYTHSLQCEPRG